MNRRAATPATIGKGASEGDRGLLTLLAMGNIAMNAVYVGVGAILLPLQIEELAPENKVITLGVITAINALFSTIVNPIAGALSDRSGRRNPWILGGAFGTLVAAALLGQAQNVAVLAVFLCLTNGSVNVFQAALTAIVPDRVPAHRRGIASAMVGLGIPLGAIIGGTVAAALDGHLSTAYVALGGLILFAAALFANRLPEREVDRIRHTDGLQLSGLLTPLRNHDFRWAFIGRALLVLGYFTISTYQPYTLDDYIDLPDGLKPATAVAILLPTSGVCLALSIVVGGIVADRTGRLKPLILIASLSAAVFTLIPVLSPTWPAMLTYAALSGLAFGCFIAVDTALVTFVLPSAGDTARDMGVLNVANAGPQVLAPVVASLVVAISGYADLFVAGAVCSVLGGLAVLPIRAVR